MEHNKSGEKDNHMGSTIWVSLTCDVIQFYLLGLLFFKGEVAHLTKMVAIPYIVSFYPKYHVIVPSLFFAYL